MSRSLQRYALLSIAAAVVTIGMKAAAYLVTGSVGLLSDALESGVNLLAAVTAYLSLIYAARPADQTHTYGHEKIEFFASGLEGMFILLAGVGTAAYGFERIRSPQPLESLELGTAIALAATVVNLVVARTLLRVGRAHNSIVLQADGHHLMADVFTSAGILVGLALVSLTGYAILDPILAIVVGLNILATGVGLMRRSFNGLMDHALPPEEQKKLRETIRAALPVGMDFHALRTRQAGAKTFAEFHLLVSGEMSVREAHEYAHRVEDRLCDVMPGITVTIHVEPIDDASSWESVELARLGETTLPTGPPP
ncbi:cation diffusion facilitator family transporter [Limnoglobus roseus]|uniref:Cation transporter n=1 Tax=Limnoglobus roseus TaxID=2598579 RepID=A0A5C1AR79_9BACT|nr:cation diffusion facilitator family transporter [Limnoglobus roseus]QEL19704.1 cation transporter [Limnoglobus roseus]